MQVEQKDREIEQLVHIEVEEAVRRYQWRNPKTNEIKAIKNRAQGVCLSCAKEIMKRQ